MKIARLPFQLIALLLQSYFIVETIGMFVIEQTEEKWFSMLFTLLIVIACEVFSFIDILLFVISKHNKYSFINLAVFIINALLFMTVIYYSSVGTVIGLSFYVVLFVIRIVNLVLNSIDILKKIIAIFFVKTSQKTQRTKFSGLYPSHNFIFIKLFIDNFQEKLYNLVKT